LQFSAFVAGNAAQCPTSWINNSHAVFCLLCCYLCKISSLGGFLVSFRKLNIPTGVSLANGLKDSSITAGALVNCRRRFSNVALVLLLMAQANAHAFEANSLQIPLQPAFEESPL